ncbi:hypothetical protein ACSBPQ_05895 [Stenotrophomonas sp. JC08]|uniref:hypothetical protein n=1 Tax=Stenotrophomonas sp. JC08 TaxID=3445779 RepID=UPI003FA218CA
MPDVLLRPNQHQGFSLLLRRIESPFFACAEKSNQKKAWPFSFEKKKQPRHEAKLSLLLRRSEHTFLCSCKERWPKESTAGREPMRWNRIGPLCSLRIGAARNSLRSDTRAFFPRSAAVLGLLYGGENRKLKQMRKQNQGSGGHNYGQGGVRAGWLCAWA